jgi:hypothetical protein
VAALTRAVVAAFVSMSFATAAAVAAPAASTLKVMVDKGKVDLKGHRLEVKMSRPAGKVKITVYDESNAKLADEEQDFSGRPGGTPLIVTWNPSSDAAVAKIELRAYDAQGNWVGVELAPWFVNIPHDDVNFRTDSSEIDAAEVPKVESAFGKIAEALAKDAASGRMHAGITLYIDGMKIYARTKNGALFNVFEHPEQPLLMVGQDLKLRELTVRESGRKKKQKRS